MRLSMQTPDVRLRYLAESYDEAFLEFVALEGDDLYEETVIPRAIKFALNELISEFAGDATQCKDYVISC